MVGAAHAPFARPLLCRYWRQRVAAKRNKMSILFQLAVLSIMTVIAVMMYRDFSQASANNLATKLAFCGSIAGLLGFAEVAWIGLLPNELLDHFEMPNTLGADRLTAPDGRVFIVSSPIARVQRYGPEGFEKGFNYGHKAFTFGMSASGNILICAAGGELLTYSPDGVEVQPRRSCLHGVFDRSLASYASNAKVPTIAFNWFSALAVPLWHPVAGWLVLVLGGLLRWLFSAPQADAPGEMAES
jgi:hypothetical protein